MKKEQYMDIALNQAKKAFNNNETPVGAVIVLGDKIIAKAYNLKEKRKKSIYHAEILAIKRACKKVRDWRLTDSVLYVTLEPCMMCWGAILESRISKVYFGAYSDSIDPKIYDILKNKNIEIIGGLEKGKCSLLLKQFFKNKRK